MTSFAGMNRTFTNVRGVEAVLDAVVERVGVAVRRAGPGLPSARAQDAEPAIAVVVQAMVAGGGIGVAFTADPVTGDGTGS